MLDDAPPQPDETPGLTDRLYPRLLGDSWSALDPAVQWVHVWPTTIHGSGTFQVSRAAGRLMGLILNVARVPPSSVAMPVTVTVHRRGRCEWWHRVFDGVPLVTAQAEAPGGRLAERIGLLEFQFRLAVKRGALLFRQEGVAVRLGRLRLPVPDWLAITVAGREGPAPPGAQEYDLSGDRTAVDIRVTGPGGGLLFAYRGTVRWTPGGHVR